MPWRRAWKPTPAFLPGESHGQSIVAGCSPWECKESDTNERLSQIEQKELKTKIHLYCPLHLPVLPPLLVFFISSVIIPCPFISPWMTPFSISCRVGLLVTNHLNFCFSGNVLISHSLLRVFLVEYTIFSQLSIYIFSTSCMSFTLCMSSGFHDFWWDVNITNINKCYYWGPLPCDQ